MAARRAGQPEPPFRIDALLPAGGGSAVSVRAGGSVLGRVDAGAASALGLRAGAVVGPEQWPALAAALARRGAFDAGARLLGLRARTRAALERRLRLRFGEEAAAEAVRRLAPYLDDAAFARAWIEERLRLRPLGAAALVAGLCREGLARPAARAAVDEALAASGGGGERERCLELARARRARLGAGAPERAAARLWSYLARRGFSGADIRAALRALALDAPGAEGPE